MWDIPFVKENYESITDYQQLAYVFPVNSLHCLPEKISNKIKKYKMENDSIEITWSFCKYFWESHIEFNMENLEEVCKIVNNVV